MDRKNLFIMFLAVIVLFLLCHPSPVRTVQAVLHQQSVE